MNPKILLSTSTSAVGRGSLRPTFRHHLEEASKRAANVEFRQLGQVVNDLHSAGISGTDHSIGHIAIVGAGMAGLHAAMQILQKEAMPVDKITIFEASDEEGGRLFTHRFKCDPTVYCEIGGMRLPSKHKRLHNLLDLLASETIRKELERTGNTVEQIPYVMTNKKGRVYVNGKRAPPGHTKIMTQAQADELVRNEGATSLGFPGSIPNDGKTAQEQIDEVMAPFVKQLRTAAAKGSEELKRVFLELARGGPGRLALDGYSLTRYLKEEAKWSDDQVAYVEAMTDQANAFQVSFMEQLIDNYEFDSDGPWTTIKSGLQRLPAACRQLLQMAENVDFKFNTRVVEVSLPFGQGGQVVLLGVKTPPSTGKQGTGNRDEQKDSFCCCPSDGPAEPVELGRFDKVLLALPPTAVRMMKVPDSWSQLKRESLRAMRYDPIRKIGLLFKTRWWEHLAEDSIEGGQSITDLPSRWIVYPSNDIGAEGKGALLCYCWTNDAYAHLSLTHEEKVQQALRDVSEVHGKVVRDEFIEAFPFEWSLSYAGGIAFFSPGQWQRYYAAMLKPEGRVYFAGEHLSVHHAWVEGALDSAQQAVCQMYCDHLKEHPPKAGRPGDDKRILPQGQVEQVLSDLPLDPNAGWPFRSRDPSSTS